MLFDLGWSELMLIGIVALIFIGPKDLPKALRVAGFWVRKARTLSREFQSSIDQMIREAELDEVRQELKKATEIDLEKEFHNTIDPKGELAESLKPPELPDFSEPAKPIPVAVEQGAEIAAPTRRARVRDPAVRDAAVRSNGAGSRGGAGRRGGTGTGTLRGGRARHRAAPTIGVRGGGGGRAGGRARSGPDAAPRSSDRAAQPADVGDRRDHGRFPDLLSVQGAHLRLSGAPARRHFRGADRAAPDLYGPDRGLFHLCQSLVLGGAVPRLPDRGDPNLEIRGAGALQERAGGVLSVSLRHPDIVRDGCRHSPISL